MKVSQFLILAMTALVVWGCSGQSAYNNNPQSPIAQSPALTPTSVSSLVIINIPGEASSLGSRAYGPNPLTINAGSTVMWINNDNMPHTVTSDSGLWDSGAIMPNSSFSFIISVPGTYTYHCLFHSNMTGTLQVVSPAGYTGARF